MNRNRDTVTSTGAVCQQLERSQPLSRRYEPIPRSTFNLNYRGFLGGVPVKHRKIRRVNPAGVSSVRSNECWRQRCLFFFVIGGAGALQVLFCAAQLRSSFKSRMPGCQPGDAGAIPADRTNFQHTAGARLRSEVSKTLPARGGTETPCQFQNAGWPNGKAAAS